MNELLLKFDRGRPPTAEELAEAWDSFESDLAAFEPKLRTWLAEYQTAAAGRVGRLEVRLQISNGPEGAHAQSVRVTLALPDGVSPGRHANPKSVELPPEAPHYRRPTQFSKLVGARAGLPSSLYAKALGELRNPRTARSDVRWNDRGETALELGTIYMGETVKLTPLHLVAAPGVHRMQCTVYSTSLASPLTTEIELDVPEPVSGPAFGSLYGILQYPDIDIVDADGEVVHAARESDPPVQAPTLAGDADIREKLVHGVAFNDWTALGLDPAYDLMTFEPPDDTTARQS